LREDEDEEKEPGDLEAGVRQAGRVSVCPLHTDHTTRPCPSQPKREREREKESKQPETSDSQTKMVTWRNEVGFQGNLKRGLSI